MEILKFTPDMAEEVSKLYALTWKDAYKGIMTDEYLNSIPLDRWTGFLTYGSATSFVIKDNGKIVATSSVSPARDVTMHGFAEIISLYVLPSFTKRGYGTALINNAVSELKSEGYDKLYLWVLEENKLARNFYKKHKFIPNGDEFIINIDGKELTELRYIYQTN